MVKKVKGGYKVLSHKGKAMSRVLNKKAAEKRLAQVEYFKRKKGRRMRGVLNSKYGKKKSASSGSHMMPGGHMMAGSKMM